MLLSVPASSAVLERDFSTAGRLITGPRSSVIAADAEMMFPNGNQDHIRIEVTALSSEQVHQAVPRRLSNSKAEVAALLAGEAGSGGEVGVDTAYDEYAGEAGSEGEEGVRAKRALTPAVASPQGMARTRSPVNEWGQRQICYAFYLLVNLSSAYFLREADGLFLSASCLFLFAPCGRQREAVFEGRGCTDFRCCGA